MGGLTRLMKKITINGIGIVSLANFLGAMGAVTGAIKAIVLPILALAGAGALGDVDTAIKSVSEAVSKDIGNVLSFGIAGWIGGAAYAWIANKVLGLTNGITINTK
tara:strand:+ start:322 stop:639 length:318 start_codon:yes stop_codon:yes gene_type:complete